MQNGLPFDQWHQLFETEFTTIGKSLEEFSSLHHRLPIPERIKKRFVDVLLKEKSAWYACLVNSNIDVLLIPEYLESRQSRNILIKKETDQYFKSLENFNTLAGKSNVSLYECMLVTGEVNKKADIDLFSNCVPDVSTCPEITQNLFENWNLTLSGYGKLESLIFAFYEWFLANERSFANHRQIVLWLNYQLWREYGPVAYSLNLENYLLLHWQKENNDAINAVKGLMNFLKMEVEKHKSALYVLFKEHIDFSSLKSQQRLASGYLFSIGFDVKLPEHLNQQAIIKTLIKKGYIELRDLGQKPDLEKVKSTLDELFAMNLIYMVNDEDERFISINPSYKANPGRLFGYSNIEELRHEVHWDEFIKQTIKVEIPKVVKTLQVPEAETHTVRKMQKAFLG